jgi:hypothetical protein
MNRTSFDALLDRIVLHPIFHRSTSFRERREPKFQLQVALYYFGAGSSGSRIRTALLLRLIPVPRLIVSFFTKLYTLNEPGKLYTC